MHKPYFFLQNERCGDAVAQPLPTAQYIHLLADVELLPRAVPPERLVQAVLSLPKLPFFAPAELGQLLHGPTMEVVAEVHLAHPKEMTQPLAVDSAILQTLAVAVRQHQLVLSCKVSVGYDEEAVFVFLFQHDEDRRATSFLQPFMCVQL